MPGATRLDARSLTRLANEIERRTQEERWPVSDAFEEWVPELEW